MSVGPASLFMRPHLLRLWCLLLLPLSFGGCTMFPTRGGTNPGTDTAISRATGAREGQTVNRATGSLY